MSKAALERIKAFGMTNQMLAEDLTRVGSVHNVDLGHLPSSPQGLEDVYYPQFDSAIRLEAASMAKHYEVFYSLEKSFDSVQVLIRHRLPEEALLPARSLFEDSLRLQDLAAAGEGRFALELGWHVSSLREAKGLLQTAVEAGLERNPARILAILADREKAIRANATRRGVDKQKPFRTAKDAARFHGRSADLWIHGYSHEVVHGSDMAFLYNRALVEPGTLTHSATTNDADLDIEIAQFACESLLHSALSAGMILGVANVSVVQPQLDKLREERSRPQ